MTRTMTRPEFDSDQENYLGKWLTNAYILFMSGLWLAFIPVGSPAILSRVAPIFIAVLVGIFIVLAILASVCLNIFLVRLLKFPESSKVYQDLADSSSPLGKVFWAADAFLALPWLLVVLVGGVDPGWFGLIPLIVHIASSIVLFKEFRSRSS